MGISAAVLGGGGGSSGIKNALNPIKVTKNVLRTGSGALKNTIKAALNPIKATKETLSDPLGQAMKFTGMDTVFGFKGGGSGSNGVNETAEYESGTNDDASAQERNRMISRQGMQGTNPIMLLGQDVKDTALNHDEKIGGKDR